jgi:hypothetical protein
VAPKGGVNLVVSSRLGQACASGFPASPQQSEVLKDRAKMDLRDFERDRAILASLHLRPIVVGRKPFAKRAGESKTLKVRSRLRYDAGSS